MNSFVDKDERSIKCSLLFWGISIILLVLSSCAGLPDSREVDNIPNYYFFEGYLDGRVNEINETIEMCSDSCETFFWVTDMHWESNLNANHSPALIKYISSRTGVSKIFNGGDTGDSHIITSNAISRLKDAIGSNKVYSVNGNHEMMAASQYEKPYERVSEVLRGHCDDISYGDNDESYFYLDDFDTKTRYIGLSTYGLYIDNVYESLYQGEQLDWLRTVALSVDEGWTIIIITHCIYSVKRNSDELIANPEGAQNFIDIIDSYSGKGTIACVLIGHSHRDRIHIGSTGVPYIISAPDRFVPYDGDINVTRNRNTITEQHFEVVIVDKKNRLIYLYAVGANARDGYDNNKGKEVNLRCVKYR